MSTFHSPGDNAGTPAPRRDLPERPSLEQLRKQSKDLLRAAAGDGFVLPTLVRPVELTSGRRWKLSDGTDAPADDVFAMFVAARDGDVATAARLVAHTPLLAIVEYNYTPPIHFAVREGHVRIVQLLLEHGADPAYRSYPFKESLLTFAEERGHAELAQLLRQHLSRRFALASGTQAILAGAASGNLAVVESELARDATLASASNDTGDTALHRAAKHGHVHIVRVLLAAGANVDAVRGDGYRPVHCALMPNWFFQEPLGARDTVADLLLAAGAQYTMFIAALRGDMRFVRDALTRDRSLANFGDSCHHRALSAAVRRGDVAMTRLLLEHGADPNLSEEGAPRGLSLWIAVNDRQRELVRLLLAHGADPNADVESSGTPMSQAARDAGLTELLREHGGRLPAESARDRVGQLVQAGKLDEAEVLLRANMHWIHDDLAGWGDGILAGPAHDGQHDLIAMLLRLGARVPTVTKWAPYYYFKHEATAAFLLEHGMDPDHMNWHRFTLLHHMAAEGELAKATLLLNHGASIDAIDDEYRSTPLGVASRCGQLALVQLLLERGADPVAAGASWATPLAWAERKGHHRVADVLRNAGPTLPGETRGAQ